jgi:SAM-dependent methyltransferase
MRPSASEHGGRSIDYQRHASAYARHRRPDPRIAAHIDRALADARTVVNVGAGTGSYEPADRYVLAIEPSRAMRAHRPPHLPPAIDASADALPLDDNTVDAAMAILTLHHWSDPDAGLRELRRVTRRRVVVLTFDIELLAGFWFFEYLPEALEDDLRRFPPLKDVVAALGGALVERVPIPQDCTDGFFEAHFGRPEMYLDSDLRKAQSVWPRLGPGVEQRAIASLSDDLRSGRWDARHRHLRQVPSRDGGLRLIVASEGIRSRLRHPAVACDQSGPRPYGG